MTVILLALGFPTLASSSCLGRSLACMLMMEFIKASCRWEMQDEMEWEPIRLWRAATGHLIGRPWMQDLTVGARKMFSSVFVSAHNSEP